MTSSASLKIIVVYFYGTYLIGIICKSKEKNLEIYGTNMEIHEKKVVNTRKQYGNPQKKNWKYTENILEIQEKEEENFSFTAHPS